jgi:hypothetical protein
MHVVLGALSRCDGGAPLFDGWKELEHASVYWPLREEEKKRAPLRSSRQFRRKAPTAEADAPEPLRRHHWPVPRRRRVAQPLVAPTGRDEPRTVVASAVA